MTSLSEHKRTPEEWAEIIKRGTESDVLDYKAAQNWHELSRGGKAKFVRHCLALANTKGGCIVVGVSEDKGGRPVLLTGLTDEQAHSFDPTAVGSFISRFTDPPVDFTLERPVVDGKCFAVFDVRPFSSLPHVCTATCEDELLQGVFYIRTPDASSRPAFRSPEIHGLIQRAMRHQRKALEEMIRNIFSTTENPHTEAEILSRYAEESGHSRGFFLKRAKPEIRQRALFADFTVFPENAYQEDRFRLAEIRNAVEKLYPLAENTLPPEEAYFTNTSLRAFDSDKGICQIFCSGLLHALHNLTLEKTIDYGELSEYLEETMNSAKNIYDQLCLPDLPMQVQFRLMNTQQRVLANVPGCTGNAVCRIPEIDIRRSFTAEDYRKDPKAVLDDILKAVCERFNCFVPEDLKNNGEQR